jgi:arginine/serine-rich splicing factor 17
MNEMKPGHRPDTIHIKNLPVKWFGGDRPRTNVLIEVFSTFGEIRRFHVPCLDELRPEAGLDSARDKDGFKKFTFKDCLNFDAYIMYREYIGFVKAMEALRGKKLVRKLDVGHNKYLEYDIEVDFDKTKHLSDKSIKRRRLNKEYGVQSSHELKTLKEETRRQRKLYEERVKLLHNRKEKAKEVMKLVLEKAAKVHEVRKVAEEKAAAEQCLKDRLLQEEAKLRERLLEKRREMIRKKVAEKGSGLKSTVSSSSGLNSLSSQSSKVSEHYSSLYKNHKSNCKHYKTKSIVIVRRDENK